MTPKELKALKTRILEYIRYWRPILDLENWTIKVQWNNRGVASSLAQPDYKVLHLKFNLKRIAGEIDDLEELVLHELVHGPLWLLSRGIEDRKRTKKLAFIEENTTCTVTNALMRARMVGGQRLKRRK